MLFALILHLPVWLGISALVWALFVLVVLLVVLVGLVAIVRGPAALKGLLSASVRLWVYDVVSGGLLITMGMGLISGNLASLWLGFVAGVLRVARANVPTGTTGATVSNAPLDPAAIASAIAAALKDYLPASANPAPATDPTPAPATPAQTPTA